MLIIAFAASTAYALFDLWTAYDPTPAMSHSVTPTSQTITSASQSFTVTAKITDMDTFQRTVPPNDLQQMSGNENDVIFDTNFNNQTSVNISFNSSTGERTREYFFGGPFNLLDSGDIAYETYSIRGVDAFSAGARHDVTTNYGTSTVAKHYVPHAEPGGG